ncbi:MAG: hypothetical protein MJZ67_05940 [Bacteroidales bacterium]|nr:hypothetical protein [Bacteroidales bacterium]
MLLRLRHGLAVVSLWFRRCLQQDLGYSSLGTHPCACFFGNHVHASMIAMRMLNCCLIAASVGVAYCLKEESILGYRFSGSICVFRTFEMDGWVVLLFFV